MLSIKPKTASTNILEDALPSTTVSDHYDRYRKNIVLNLLLRYFTIPNAFYFQTNVFYRPVSSTAMGRLAQLSLREVWSSFFGPVKLETVSPVTCHRCDIFLESKLSCPGSKPWSSRPSLYPSAYNTKNIMKI